MDSCPKTAVPQESSLRGFQKSDDWESGCSQLLLDTVDRAGLPDCQLLLPGFQGEQFKDWEGLWERKKMWNFSRIFLEKLLILYCVTAFLLAKWKWYLLSPWSQPSPQRFSEEGQTLEDTICNKRKESADLWQLRSPQQNECNTAIPAHVGVGRVQD